jgi:hypothetical protein
MAAPAERQALSAAGTSVSGHQRFDGKLNTVPSRTPADGQRCVIVLRFV